MITLFIISFGISVFAGLAFLLGSWNLGWSFETFSKNWSLLFLTALAGSGCIMPDVFNRSVVVIGFITFIICLNSPQWAYELFEKYLSVITGVLGMSLLFYGGVWNLIYIGDTEILTLFSSTGIILLIFGAVAFSNRSKATVIVTN